MGTHINTEHEQHRPPPVALVLGYQNLIRVNSLIDGPDPLAVFYDSSHVDGSFSQDLITTYGYLTPLNHERVSPKTSTS